MLSYRKPIINAVSAEIPGPALSLGLPALPAHGHREKGTPPQFLQRELTLDKAPLAPARGWRVGTCWKLGGLRGSGKRPKLRPQTPARQPPT